MTGPGVDVVSRAGRDLAACTGVLFRAARRGDQVEWLRSARQAVVIVDAVHRDGGEDVALEVVLGVVIARCQLAADLMAAQEAVVALMHLPEGLVGRFTLVSLVIGAVARGETHVVATAARAEPNPVAVATQLLTDLIQFTASMPAARHL